MSLFQQRRQPWSNKSLAGLAVASTAAAVAAWLEYRSRRASRVNPPEGQFIEVDGVRLHCVERGEGPAAVLLMMPAARKLSGRLRELSVPVTIVAGACDAIADFEAHSKRLHETLPGSRLVVVPGAGHMVHHVAQQQIAEAVSAESAATAWAPPGASRTEPALVAR